MGRIKRIAAINSTNCGSTGGIMAELGRRAADNGYRYIKCFPQARLDQPHQKDDIVIASMASFAVSCGLGFVTGYNGCFSILPTLALLKKLEKYAPDMLHLHNLHNCYINFPLLFNFIKKKNISVIWTLHDCWSFTGLCPHFEMIKCLKWQTGCYECPQTDLYPKTLFDRTSALWNLKKKSFTGVKDMTIVTPSQWLADLVKRSYLKDYPVKVINNGIELNIFKPSPSSFRQKHNISDDEYMLLGVAYIWVKRKGMDVFLELVKRLPKKFRIVLIGTNATADKKLPDNIICIPQTSDKQELAEIYTAADLLVNPTREETFGLVNAEALACGTPVVTFRAGGSPEIIDKTCGSIVERDDIDELEKEIIRISSEKPFSKQNCITRAQNYDINDKFAGYIDLYKTLLS